MLRVSSEPKYKMQRKGEKKKGGEGGRETVSRLCGKLKFLGLFLYSENHFKHVIAQKAKGMFFFLNFLLLVW